MLLAQEVAAGAYFGDDVHSQGLFVHGDAAHDALDHADGLIGHDQHVVGANQAGFQIPHVVDQAGS